jgi:hypothetical protein
LPADNRCSDWAGTFHGVGARLLRSATNGGAYRIIDLLEQTGNSHKAITNRLDLLQPMLRRDPFEHDEERMEA